MIDLNDLYKWCSVPIDELVGHQDLKIPLRIVKDSVEVGETMAKDFAMDIWQSVKEGREYNAIIPCGPKDWYAPFARIINENGISLRNVTCFHMDENLDWEAKLLPENDPNNFRTFMQKYFYDAVDPELRVPKEKRYFLTPDNVSQMTKMIEAVDIDYTLGGWGQDGHVAFNQAKRSPYSVVTIDDLRRSTAHVQENNVDTIIALAQRGLGSAWQFMPPMSVTLGVKECFKAKKIRVYSATGAWKQTALRVALFSEVTPEYPVTLLQEHPNALITASEETARHPISENPDWEFRGVSHLK